jgi:hypothetical protein
VRCDADGYCGDDPNHPTNTTWTWYKQQMHDKYGWEETGKWTYQEYRILSSAGTKIENYINGIGGNGHEWIKNNLGNTTFYRTTNGDITNNFLGNRPGSVPWKNGINLSKGFDDNTVIHELGHRWDNSSTGSWCPSTWCGGGSADELVKSLGGDPRFLRWKNGISGIPSEYQWSIDVDSGYGNTASAEYFAQSFLYLIIDQSKLPTTKITEWMNNEILK